MNRSRLREIAKRAGVSTMTASNVINAKEGHYSEETYARVMRAVEEIGYVPNIAAKHLRKGKIGLIALILSDIMNPYFSELAQFLIQKAEAKGFIVMLSFTDTDPQKATSLMNGTLQLPVDGILLATPPVQTQEMKANLPIVLIGEQEGSLAFDTISLDHAGIARMATNHLIEIGRRRIAPIGIVRHDSSDFMAHPRAEGYQLAMQAAGLPVRKEWLIPLPESSLHRDYGAYAMQKLLAQDNPPDAVFCFNDLLAIGAMKVLLEKGVRVPDDVAVIGIDDIIEGRYANPALSTVSIDRRGMSELAVDLIIDRISGKCSGPPQSFQTLFSLTPRTSTIGDKFQEAIETIVPVETEKPGERQDG